MSEGETQFVTVGEGAHRRRIAYLAQRAKAGQSTVMWMIGLKSDMVSTKAAALAAWALEQGLGCLRFDYSGHGQSGGDFEQATLSDWAEEALQVLDCADVEGPIILMGSSTGAQVALMVLKRLIEAQPERSKRVKALVLVAPAWDLADLMWDELPASARAEIESKGLWMRPSPYDSSGYAITKTFIEDGRRHRFKGADFNPGRPVLVLQGAQDRDVPLAYALELEQVLSGGWVKTTVIPDGDHRLSRPEDIQQLLALVEIADR